MDSLTTLFLYWNQWEVQLSPELQMLVLQRDWLEDNADFNTETELWENPWFLAVLYNMESLSTAVLRPVSLLL